MKYSKPIVMRTIAGLLLFVIAAFNCHSQQPLRVVIAGLNHDHIHGILQEYKKGNVLVVGIVEENKSLQVKYSGLYQLADSLFFTDLRKVIAEKKPDAVLAYNAVGKHLEIVQICAPLGIPVMVEKPLAATLEQARTIDALANRYHIQVLTNYETTWYPSCQEIKKLVTSDSIGGIRKMIVHDGHQGPKEIGCSAEFLQWLTDPILNGAGALNDFGCYGAVLMTWLMNGSRPTAVTAITRHYKPEIYPNVDDDATVLLEYPKATGLIEASWNWPFSIKDLEVFGETGYYHALDGKTIVSRMRENRKATADAAPLAAPYTGQIPYLTGVLRHTISPEGDMSSLKYNMVMMEILDAAKRSAKSGKRIVL
jgi:predicted dehydrogenase